MAVGEDEADDDAREGEGRGGFGGDFFFGLFQESFGEDVEEGDIKGFRMRGR